MFALAIVPLALAASALANVFITKPVASTTFTAGQDSTVSWQDSGDGPTLAQFGIATFGIYAGNAIQQTLLQTIATNVNVSSTSSFTFKPDATIGPNSGVYFMRVTSLSMTSPGSQFPAEAFSSMFSLGGMSGTFNSSVQAEINGESTAPIGGTSASIPATTAMAMPTSMSGMSMTIASASAASASATGTSTTKPTSGAGKPAMATGIVALVAALVGASFL